MFGHFAPGTQSGSSLLPDDENGPLCTEDDDSITFMGTQPETQAQHQRPWHMSNSAADHGCKPGRQFELQREGTASMDVLTHKFSNSHLRLDNGIPPPLSLYSASACSSMVSLGQLPEPMLGTASCYRTSSSGLPDRHAATLPTTSTTEPDLNRHPHNPKQDVRRLRRKPSSRFLNELEANDAIQTRVEDMISAGSQCNVYIPPLVPIVPIEADENDGIDYGMGTTGLEVDEGVGGDDESELALIDRLLSLRRASGTLGIRKSGFPLYRSSTDTALRCQNLVRNQPRMRRRKVRQKPSLSTISAEESRR